MEKESDEEFCEHEWETEIATDKEIFKNDLHAICVKCGKRVKIVHTNEREIK